MSDCDEETETIRGSILSRAALVAELAAANARAEKAEGAYDRMNTQRIETERSLQARLNRVKELAYGEADLAITADSPPPHTRYIDQARLRAALDGGKTP